MVQISIKNLFFILFFIFIVGCVKQEEKQTGKISFEHNPVPNRRPHNWKEIYNERESRREGPPIERIDVPFYPELFGEEGPA